MGKREDLTGRVFGRLTVIEYAGYIKKQAMWKCKCECGEEKIVRKTSLVSGKTKSCGCLKKEVANDLTGQEFGKLTVIEHVGLDKSKNAMWKCRCKCGKELIVKGPNLKAGHTKSCGCLRNEIREDLTGKVFGKLTVIEHAGSRKGERVWKCKCECGNELTVPTGPLNSGKTKSCGCSRKKPKSFEDLTGKVFERLTVIENLGLDETKKFTMWKCRCECGNEIITRKHALKNGRTKSCGCHRVETQYQKLFKHGMFDTAIYRSWQAMKRRCQSPTDVNYVNYGGRGIKVFEEWNDFEAFYRDMGDTHKEGLTLDRIDVNGDYTPENCRWATMMEQGNNKRNTIFITVFGETLPISEVARKYNMNRNTLYQRIRRGMTPEAAVMMPVERYMGRKKK